MMKLPQAAHQRISIKNLTQQTTQPSLPSQEIMGAYMCPQLLSYEAVNRPGGSWGAMCGGIGHGGRRVILLVCVVRSVKR